MDVNDAYRQLLDGLYAQLQKCNSIQDVIGMMVEISRHDSSKSGHLLAILSIMISLGNASHNVDDPEWPQRKRLMLDEFYRVGRLTITALREITA